MLNKTDKTDSSHYTAARLYGRISEFLHATVPTFTSIAVIFDWLPGWVGTEKPVRRVTESYGNCVCLIHSPLNILCRKGGEKNSLD